MLCYPKQNELIQSQWYRVAPPRKQSVIKKNNSVHTNSYKHTFSYKLLYHHYITPQSHLTNFISFLFSHIHYIHVKSLEFCCFRNKTCSLADATINQSGFYLHLTIITEYTFCTTYVQHRESKLSPKKKEILHFSYWMNHKNHKNIMGW